MFYNVFKFIIFLAIFIASANASDKNKIIENLKKTKNFEFKFEQNINGKIENGKCTIEYPKKIFCDYKTNNQKILVSNGRSLVIKTLNSYYLYPIEKTPLNLILNKDFLLQKIKKLKERKIGENFINYKFIEKENEINLFFDKKTFNLIGWQTKDIYQNTAVTLLYSVKSNQVVNKKIFKTPLQN